MLRCISYSRWGFSIAMFVYRRVHGISPDGMFSLDSKNRPLLEARPGIINLVFLQGVGPFDEGAKLWGHRGFSWSMALVKMDGTYIPKSIFSSDLFFGWKKQDFGWVEVYSRCFNLASPGMFSALNMIVIHMDKLSMNYHGVSARAMSPLTKRLETTSIWYVGVTFQVACILPGCHTKFFKEWLVVDLQTERTSKISSKSWCPCLTTGKI